MTAVSLTVTKRINEN